MVEARPKFGETRCSLREFGGGAHHRFFRVSDRLDERLALFLVPACHQLANLPRARECILEVQATGRQGGRMAPKKAVVVRDRDYAEVLDDVAALLVASRSTAARAVNSLMTSTYWLIGRRIVEGEQRGRGRAEYGEQLIERLSRDLTSRFGRGFGRRNLFQMRAFFLERREIVQTLSAQSGAGKKVQTASAQLVSARPPAEQLLKQGAAAFPLPWLETISRNRVERIRPSAGRCRGTKAEIELHGRDRFPAVLVDRFQSIHQEPAREFTVQMDGSKRSGMMVTLATRTPHRRSKRRRMCTIGIQTVPATPRLANRADLRLSKTI